jgi:hypothetical protein
MSLLAYQTEEPGEGDHPMEAQSTGLEFVKKAISSFMPNRNVQRNVESQTGNPAMSVAVNDLIKMIKKAKVRKLGKKSNLKRDMKRVEFCKCLRLLEAERGNFLKCHRVTAMLKLQFHIIGRADDISNLETIDLRVHEQFNVALQMLLVEECTGRAKLS